MEVTPPGFLLAPLIPGDAAMRLASGAVWLPLCQHQSSLPSPLNGPVAKTEMC